MLARHALDERMQCTARRRADGSAAVTGLGGSDERKITRPALRSTIDGNTARQKKNRADVGFPNALPLGRVLLEEKFVCAGADRRQKNIDRTQLAAALATVASIAAGSRTSSS